MFTLQTEISFRYIRLLSQHNLILRHYFAIVSCQITTIRKFLNPFSFGNHIAEIKTGRKFCRM